MVRGASFDKKEFKRKFGGKCPYPGSRQFIQKIAEQYKPTYDKIMRDSYLVRVLLKMKSPAATTHGAALLTSLTFTAAVEASSSLCGASSPPPYTA
jgi:hypothetical protein